jgi:hypothetical protein
VPIGTSLIVNVTELDDAFYGPGGSSRFGLRTIGPRVTSLPGMEPPIVLGSGAGAAGPSTRDALRRQVARAAERLTQAGDTLFLYYAGQVAVVPAGVVGPDERAVLCLTDGFLLDVELVSLWSKFARDARILFVAERIDTRTVDEDRAARVAEDNLHVGEWYAAAISDGGRSAISGPPLRFAARGPDQVIMMPRGPSPLAAALLSGALPDWQARAQHPAGVVSL